LAGPVFAAAVVLPQDVEIEGINDSKKLTEKKREALFDVICREAVAYCIAAPTSGRLTKSTFYRLPFWR
jgi:ribonuclease HII